MRLELVPVASLTPVRCLPAVVPVFSAPQPQVFAAEFFSRRLTLHRIRKGDWRSGRMPSVVSSEVLDDTLGPAYSVVLADLEGQGRPSHVLVSSHECQYEGFEAVAAANGEDKPRSLLHRSPI